MNRTSQSAAAVVADHVLFHLRYLPGLVLCLVLAGAGIAIGTLPWMGAHGLSPLTVATVLGMALGNIVSSRWLDGAGTGIVLAKHGLLRLGIVLYGVKLTLQDIGRVGGTGLMIDGAMVLSTFTIAWIVGTRVLRMDRQTTLLIGAGSSICGAAAVLATEPVVEASADKVTVAVATVVVFGTLAIFLYPLLYRSGLLQGILPHGGMAFGIYEGSTIHEVAQVLAAAQSLGPSATDSAVIAKLVRVMMLAPFLIGLSAWLSRKGSTSVSTRGIPARPLAMPWFAFLFAGVVILNSVVHSTSAFRAHVNEFDMVLLGMAMAGVGLTTRIASIRHAGMRPLILGVTLWAWLVLGGAIVNGIVSRWL